MEGRDLPRGRRVNALQEYEYTLLVTNTDLEMLSLARLYRERADSENPIDELKRQWGWGREGVSWEPRAIRESWDGFPGFDVAIQYLQFRSEKYTNVHEITEAIKGRLLLKLFEERHLKIDQMPELFPRGSNRYRRTNTYDAHCLQPNLIGRVLSIQYRIHWYGAGAAHPNMHFETHNFVLEPLTLIPSLLSTFTEFTLAQTMIREEVRKVLYAVRMSQEMGDEDRALDPKWIDSGTESLTALDTFWFTQTGLEFLFAPYQVGSYADGPQSALVPYETVIPWMRREILDALGLNHVRSAGAPSGS